MRRYYADIHSPLPQKVDFGTVPGVSVKRSVFNRSHSVKTTFNASKVVPVMWEEVLPGDTIKLNVKSIVQSLTPIVPVMDAAYVDFHVFYVPNTIIFDNSYNDQSTNHESAWARFMGENQKTFWTESTYGTLSLPKISCPVGGWAVGTLADYLGLPVGVDYSSYTSGLPNSIPFNAYISICNSWYRNENVEPLLELVASKFNTVYTGDNSRLELGGQLFTAYKFNDYFTSALPEPQKGPAVAFQIVGDIPVYAAKSKSIPDNIQSNSGLLQMKKIGGEETTGKYFLGAQGAAPDPFNVLAKDGVDSFNGPLLSPSNLFASADGTTVGNINDLRTAWAIQQYNEKNARYGTRYVENINAHFGVTAPDSNLSRPEFLGAVRQPVSQSLIPQTSSTTDISPQGNTASFSRTIVGSGTIVKSFTQHGVIMVTMIVRPEHTYSQGIERKFTRSTLFDFYSPSFANLGERPILNREIYISKNESTDNSIFGYQPHWSEYRYANNRVSGLMRPSVSANIAFWNYADFFTATPTLTSDFLKETTSNIARTLAVNTENSYQFFADIAFDFVHIRPLPVNSIPAPLVRV